jgi:hypothetical protein
MTTAEPIKKQKPLKMIGRNWYVRHANKVLNVFKYSLSTKYQTTHSSVGCEDELYIVTYMRFP